MASTCNLLLRTLPAIDRELPEDDGPIRLDFGDLDRPYPPEPEPVREPVKTQT